MTSETFTDPTDYLRNPGVVYEIYMTHRWHECVTYSYREALKDYSEVRTKHRKSMKRLLKEISKDIRLAEYRLSRMTMNDLAAETDIREYLIPHPF